MTNAIAVTELTMANLLQKYLPFPEADLDKGITIVYEQQITDDPRDTVSLGISYESNPEEWVGNKYIFNLFLRGDEYINVCGEWSLEDTNNGLPKVLADEWNKAVAYF